MYHVVVDLETLGTSKRACILSIGAMMFDDSDYVMLSPFYVAVDSADASRYLEIDQATIDWWEKQSQEARAAVFEAPDTKTLSEALLEFRKWLPVGVYRIWSHGSSFDIAILSEAYRLLSQPLPWRYSDERDTRTLFELIPTNVVRADDGLPEHHALHDARSTAMQVIACMQGSAVYSGLSYSQLQREVRPWEERNFGTDVPSYHRLLGMVEEIGEITHAFLKREQGIRGAREQHDEAIRDGLGDLSVYMAAFSNSEDINLEQAVRHTWEEVRERDWIAYPHTGGRPPILIEQPPPVVTSTPRSGWARLIRFGKD